MLARERAEDELRHRHVGGRVDPVAGHVAEDDGEPAVGELEEVVEVAADVDHRRGLVDGAELEPRELGLRPRQQRALHRVGELLLLLVQARVVDRERRLRGDRQAERDGLLRDRPVGVEREELQRAEQLRRASRSGGARRSSPSRGTGTSSACGGPSSRGRGRRRGRAARRCGRQPPGRDPLHPLRAAEDRPQRLAEPLVGHVERARDQQLAARVRHADHGGVDLEQLDDGARDRVERLPRATGSARRSGRSRRARRAAATTAARTASACSQLGPELRRLLVQARVLHGDGELRGDRGDERSARARSGSGRAAGRRRAGR